MFQGYMGSMRGLVFITGLLFFSAIFSSVEATSGRSTPNCQEVDLSEVSSQELIGDDGCLIIDLGFREPGTVLEFEIIVSEGNLDLLLFEEDALVPYLSGDAYRNAFVNKASFEAASGEYDFDWQVPLSTTDKKWFLVLDNLNHDNDQGNGGQGGSSARAVVDITEAEDSYWTPYHNIEKLGAGEALVILDEGELKLDAGSTVIITVNPLDGSPDIYLQTSSQSGTMNYIAGTKSEKIESSSMLSWSVPDELNGEDLILVIDNSEENTVFRGTIMVEVIPYLSVVVIDSIVDYAYVGELITFDATSSPNLLQQILEIRWDLDSDGNYDETGMVVQNSFMAPGTYQISIEVVSQVGSTVKKYHNVSVIDEIAPISRIVGTGDGTQLANSQWRLSPGANITFDSSFSSDDHQIATVSWTLDNFSYPGGALVNLSWTEIGEHILTLTVTDPSGNSDMTNVTILVLDTISPVIDESKLDKVQVVLAGENIIFTGSASDAFDEDSTLNYTWDLFPEIDTDGDGNKRNDADLFGQTTSHFYSSEGRYNVVLTVSDPSGLQDTYAFEVVVSPMPESTSGFAIIVVISLILLVTLGTGIAGNRMVQRRHAEALLVEHNFSIEEAKSRVDSIIRTKNLPLWANAQQLAGFDSEVKTDAQLHAEAKAAEMTAIYGSGGGIIQAGDPNLGFRAPQQLSPPSELVSGEALAELMDVDEKNTHASQNTQFESMSDLSPPSNTISFSTSSSGQVRSRGVSVPKAVQPTPKDPGLRGACSSCGKGFMVNLPSGVNEVLIDCPHCGVENLFAR